MRESEREKVGIEKDTVRECGEKEVTIKERKSERKREKGRERKEERETEIVNF